MTKQPEGKAEKRWAQHQQRYRDPHEIVSQWALAGSVEPELLRCETRGRWWQTLAEADVTVLVTREYEHLVMALSAPSGRPRVSYLHVPHPSGLAVDRARRILYLASTRNPNVVYELAPWQHCLRPDPKAPAVLVPRTARYLPGRLYLHDLALVGTELHGTAVGLNAIVRLPATGGFEPVWWPRSIDGPDQPRFDKNYLQLNGIAAGPSLAASFYTASAAEPSHRRPGQRHFAVDGRGVVFSGRSRDVCGSGLTRPHSPRFHAGELWVLNSGYGEIGRMAEGRFEPRLRLGGWTRGLGFHDNLAFAGTSRVIPRFRRYAPGLDVDKSECAVHAIDMSTGRVQGSLLWPLGNQIFAIEVVPRAALQGFPFTHPPPRSRRALTRVFFEGSSF